MISYDNCHCTRKKKRKIGCDKSAYRNIFGCVSFWCIKEVSRSKFVKLNTLVVFILQAFFLTLYPQALGGKKNQFCHLSFFVLKKKNVCGIIHQHPATELSSASPGYVLDCYGSHANIIFLIFVPNTHICIIPMQPVYLQLLHQTYLE